MARRSQLGPMIAAAIFFLLHLAVGLLLFYYAAEGHPDRLITSDAGPADDLRETLAAMFWYPASYLVGVMSHLRPGWFVALLAFNSAAWGFAFYVLIRVASFLDSDPEPDADGFGKGELGEDGLPKGPPPRSWRLWWTVFIVHLVLVVIFVYGHSAAFIASITTSAGGMRAVLVFFLFHPFGPLWGRSAPSGIALFPVFNGVFWAFVAMYALRWGTVIVRRARGRSYTPPMAKG